MDDETFSYSSPFNAQTESTEGPREMPSFSASWLSSGQGTPSSVAPQTPPAPLPFGSNNGKGEGQEDDMVPVDPRRLTPNLHANLVSEILSLRRDVDSKDAIIDKLEANLASAKAEQEELENQVTQKSKETRGIKRQLQSIETGTLSALEELCKERDDALGSVADHKKRLDQSQRLLKAEQDKNDRAHKAWEADKASWEREKRQLQHKTDVAESRLKAVVDELVAQSTEDSERVEAAVETRDFAAQDQVSSLPSSPAKVKGHHKTRSSVSTLGSPQRRSVINGVSLADELDDDDDADDNNQNDVDDATPEQTVEEQATNRNTGDDSATEEVSAQSAGAEVIEQQVSNDKEQASTSATDRAPLVERSVNISSATERFTAARTVAFEGIDAPRNYIAPVVNNKQGDHNGLRTAHGRHARVKSEPVARIDLKEVPTPLQRLHLAASPKTFDSFVQTVDGSMQETWQTSNASTQTDSEPLVEDEQKLPSPPIRAPPPVPIEVPQIAIHPPDSGPSSPIEAVVAEMKEMGTQTAPSAASVFRSIAVQTDVIRVDQRRFKLPPHLLPAALRPAVASSPTQTKHTGPATFNSKASKRAKSPLPSPTETEPAIVKQTEDSTLYESIETPASDSFLRFKQSSLSDNRQAKASESDPFQGVDDAWVTDNDSAAPQPTTRAMKRPQRLGKSFDPPTPVPEDEKVVTGQTAHSQRQPSIGSRGSLDRPGGNSRSNLLFGSAKSKHIRGPSERSGSPSSRASSSAWSKSTNPPPGVTIPQRTSSIGLRQSRAVGGSSPTRASNSSPTRSRGLKRPGKPPSLRKIQSASVVQGEGSKGLTPTSASQASFVSDNSLGSPAPPLPENSQLLIYRAGHQRSSSSQTRRLSTVHPTGNASVGGSIQYNVVDAITSTMIGEWMWKYTRKRKSFGRGDSSNESSATGDQRHKRWVWLSPYERTVMWSAKQPSSETALMGKNGRKLTIESVLDVKEDASSPSNSAFNRSILILTPTRALKLTAISRDRHYLWLTALSFLAHHTSQGSLDLSFLPRSVNNSPLIIPSPVNEPDPNTSLRTSASASAAASRSGRKPWSSKTTNRSQQSSGYATPSIPEASASAENAAMAVPPRPTRPAPQAPPAEPIIPSNAAAAPVIPRVPGARNTTTYFGLPTKHGRKRSSSAAAILGLSSRPSSNVLSTGKGSSNTSKTAVTSTSGDNNSKLSTKTPHVSSAGSTTPVPTAIPPRTISSRAARYFGVSSNRQPHVSLSDETLNEKVNGGAAAPSTTVNHGAQGIEGTKDITVGLDGTTDFGGNNNFFGAAGGGGGTSTTNGGQTGDSLHSRSDSFLGSTFDRLNGLPPPPVPSLEAPESSAAAGAKPGQHAPSESVDSVAPPPIQRNPGANGQSGKKPYNPPQRKRGRLGKGKTDPGGQQPGSAVTTLAATADGS